jgi:acetylornithine deacetylase/succinyl-diaminopimelate desuccinylase-like protein
VSLHRALNKIDLVRFPSVSEELEFNKLFQELFAELGERAEGARVEPDRLRGKHSADVDRLRVLLTLRRAVVDPSG